MISYSHRKDINRIMLLYPSYESEESIDYAHNFEFLDGSDRSKIDLMATPLPLINKEREVFRKNLSIDESFKDTEEILIDKLIQCFN